MNLVKYLILLSFLFAAFTTANAQYISPTWGYGVEIGGARLDNSGNSENWVPQLRGDFQLKIIPQVLSQFGVSYATLDGSNHSKVKALKADIRFLFRPVRMSQMFPYLYAGVGAVKDININNSDYLPVIPAGIGIQTRLGRQLLLQVNGGYNLVLSDKLDGVVRTNSHMNRFTNQKQDGYFELMVGLLYATPEPTNNVSADENKDPDHDGLINVLEDKYGTDPNNSDTDEDGLNDGIEVQQYKTIPNKADSDGDRLNDGDEVLKYNSNPLKTDTDNDGLIDGDEVFKYRTDPAKSDTDADGVNDGAEVAQYKTDPIKADTDNDGLKDAEEILTYHTDPTQDRYGWRRAF